MKRLTDKVALAHGDCVEVMARLPENSVAAIVTDPPYGLSFMGKKWDDLGQGAAQRAWHAAWLEQALRVLKPGGHMVAFGGARTFHHLATATEDAGFELRDTLLWLYASGFPKSVNLGNKDPAWAGWGTALKPAFEPMVLARKPLDGTLAANLETHATGGVNIDASRVPRPGEELKTHGQKPDADGYAKNAVYGNYYPRETHQTEGQKQGGWPANVLHDGSDDATGPLGDKARFYYCAKASQKEKNAGLDHLTPQQADETRDPNAPGGNNPRNRGAKARPNRHPTVKPLALMEWLLGLVTPPGGLVLDPFAGSGTTLAAAAALDVAILGIELNADYLPIIEGRVAHFWLK